MWPFRSGIPTNKGRQGQTCSTFKPLKFEVKLVFLDETEILKINFLKVRSFGLFIFNLTGYGNYKKINETIRIFDAKSTPLDFCWFLKYS